MRRVRAASRSPSRSASGSLFWPYGSRCGAGLAGYLGAVAVVIAGGVWSAVWTWRHRAGRAHTLCRSCSSSGGWCSARRRCCRASATRTRPPSTRRPGAASKGRRARPLRFPEGERRRASPARCRLTCRTRAPRGAPTSDRSVMKTFKNFIGGEWVAPDSGEYFENRNPADTHRRHRQFPLSSARTSSARSKSAKRGFASGAARRRRRAATCCAASATSCRSARRRSPT